MNYNEKKLILVCKFCTIFTYHNLIKKHYFIAIAFHVTSARSKVISFTLTLASDYHLLYIKNPDGAMNYQSYTEPFHQVTWLCIGVFCMVFPPFLWTAIQ